MSLKNVLLLTLFGVFTSLTSWASGVPSGPAQEIFAQVSPHVFRLKTAVSADAPKASYGTAFVVGTQGLLATNYHVVSQSIQDPRKYKIFAAVGEASVEGKVVAIDILRDLALVKVNQVFPSALTIQKDPPARGSRVYSMGIPHDLNLSIADGLYNGEIKTGPYTQIQMSTPINPGMSGGPTVDSRGVVVGVNVAVLMFAQNLTFAVPARSLAQLIEEYQRSPSVLSTVSGVSQEIARQLSLAEGELKKEWKTDSKFTAGPTSQLPGWEVQQPSPSVRCWMVKVDDSRRESERRKEVTYQQCRLPQAAYVTDEIRSGFYSVDYRVVTNLKLNSLQFFDSLDDIYNDSSMKMVERPLGREEDEMSKFHCGTRLVTTAKGEPFRVDWCLRQYLKYSPLYEGRFKAVSLKPKSKHALVIDAHADGFSSEGFTEMLRVILNSARSKS